MTEKKLRKHLNRVWYHWYRLQAALNDAHNADVLVYPDGTNETVCGAHYNTRKLFEKYTKDQIAETIQSTIRSGIHF